MIETRLEDFGVAFVVERKRKKKKRNDKNAKYYMKNASKYEIISSQGEGGQLEKDHDIVLNDARLTGLF